MSAYIWIIIIGIITVLAIIFIVSVYNNLVSLRSKVRNSWSQIEVQLQRRFDLIPNLVETVKGYVKHEEKALTEIARLRTSWSNAGTVAEKTGLAGQLERSIKSILAVSENYPELKASTNFSQLQQELKNTEDKVSFSRQFYNDSVTLYNIKLEKFASNIIAGLFKFEPEELFKVDDIGNRMNPPVSFGG